MQTLAVCWSVNTISRRKDISRDLGCEVRLCLCWFPLICVFICVKATSNIASLSQCHTNDCNKNQKTTGKKAFKYAAPVSRNNLQKELRERTERITLLVSVTVFMICCCIFFSHLFLRNIVFVLNLCCICCNFCCHDGLLSLGNEI